MKKVLSMLLAVTLLLAMFVPAASAAGDYAGKTVLIYTGNLRGDVDVYAKIAAAKAEYEAQDANVVLVDAGNYLQGSAYANASRGLAITSLMSSVGYDVAAMGKYDFTYGDATTGYIYHGNFFKYYTQAELVNGAEEEEYRRNAPWAPEAVMETRPELVPASFTAVSSNITVDKENSGFYSFTPYFVVPVTDLSVGVVAFTDPTTADFLQDGFLDGYTFTDAAPEKPAGCDIVVALVNGGTPCEADIVIDATAGEPICGAYVIDNATKEIKKEELKLDLTDPTIAAEIEDMKESFATTFSVFGESEVALDGSDRANWNGETNLGDLTADALKWYAENKFEGFTKDVPVVAIQNGGNCDNFLYSGEITETDLLKALPFSPMGIGVIELTGAQLLETLEAASQRENCPGFAQVSGLTYFLDTGKEYDAGEAYGKFFRADSVSRVTITSVNGKAFDSKATYAVVCDNFLINGNDTYYTLKEAKDAGAAYANNGNGVKVRDAVAQYIQKQLNGVIGSSYASAQGRISLEKTDEVFHDVKAAAYYADAVKWARENSIVNGTGKETFGPDANMTRAALWAVLGRAAGADVDGGSPWYQKALEWAKTEGISDGTNPNGSITRQELVTMLYRNAGKPAVSGDLSKFSDASAVASWASDAMLWAVSEGLVKGSGSNLNPTATATRAQVVTILYRLMAK